jgi:[ribosomal protein S18]-alanine N-acetyltransferase
VEITLINESHIKSLMQIEAHTNAEPWVQSAFEKELLSPWFFGCEKSKLKAFVLARQMMDELELFLIAVDPKEQSKGLGSILMSELLAKAVARQITRVFLEVSELNKKAIALYKKFGFLKIDTRKNYYKNGENAWVMGLEICN